MKLAPWKESYDKPREHTKKQRHHFADKRSRKSYGFHNSHVWMWELDHKQDWVPKNWCFRTVVLDKTWESLGQGRRSNQSILKEINPEYSLGGLMLKLKLQYSGHFMRRTDSLEKTLMLGKSEEENRVTEDEMVGWHHQLNGHESEQTLGDSEGQESLACCSPWGRKVSDTT